MKALPPNEAPHEMAATDGFGNWLMPGDVVVYTTRRGSSQYLNVALIEKITAFTDYRGRTGPHLGVRRTQVTGREYRDHQGVSRATLTELARVVKLHPSHYNEAVEALLAAA